MSLFKQVNTDLEKYKPKLVTVTLEGSPRAGETKEGMLIISVNVDDAGQLPVNEDRLKSYSKRVCFMGEKVAKHYLDHPDGNAKESIFMLPMIQPDDTNTYWVRKIFPEGEIKKKKA